MVYGEAKHNPLSRNTKHTEGPVPVSLTAFKTHRTLPSLSFMVASLLRKPLNAVESLSRQEPVFF